MISELIWSGLAGFAAAMVDGALGMGFGPISSTVLLSSGLSPAATSATVNIAKVASGAAAGVSHWKFGNIDRRLVARLAIPGAAGALLGVTVLRNVDGKALRPLLAVLLLAVGLRILYRFREPIGSGANRESSSNDVSKVEVVGALGGVTNGLIGAWGPVVTPFLLHRNVDPRTTVGSVNTAEVAVAAVAAGSLLATLSNGSLDIGVVVSMLFGGVVAAPLAAWVVRFVPPRAMGIAVAGLLLFTNARELLNWAGIGPGRWVPYIGVVALVALAAWFPRLSSRRTPSLVRNA